MPSPTVSQFSSASDTNRGPSAAIWNDCPWLSIFEQKNECAGGTQLWEDFTLFGCQGANTSAVAGGVGAWQWYGAASANTVPNIVDEALEGGVISLSSDGDQEGDMLSSSVGPWRLVTTSTNALNGQLWFEARVAFSTIATTKMDCFVGLASRLALITSGVPTTPGAAAGLITTTDDLLNGSATVGVGDIIGFHKKSGASTEINFVYQLTGAAVVYPTSLTTLMNTCTGAVLVAQSGQTGFAKLGFRFNPNALVRVVGTASTGQTAGAVRVPVIQPYVNGIPTPAFLTTDNTAGAAFPTGFMGAVMSCMQTATGSNKMYVDWIRVAQMPNS